MNNPNIKNIQTEILSDNWYVLRKIVFDYVKKDGTEERQEREAYDRGNGVAIFLYNQEAKTILLTRQFRMPTYVNGNDSGMMIESCAGLLDEDNPEDAIRRETEEETGYKVRSVRKIFEAYMSPGSVTEKLFFFTGEYDKNMKVSDGGGVEGEQENIEVLEMPFAQAVEMLATGEIRDAKTILLLQYAQLNRLMD